MYKPDMGKTCSLDETCSHSTAFSVWDIDLGSFAFCRYTKTPINANLMNAKPHFEKTNKCKNAMLFGKKNSKKFFEIHKKVKI
jgi:hypothetical protein